jgi:rhamnosyltransferase
MKITIVIPFYKGLNLIKNAITKLDNQKTSFEYDILIINSSEPTYNEQLLNLSKRIKVIAIDSKSFNHGSTRNLALTNTSSEFLVYTVQDAIPLNENWLEFLIQPMIEHQLDAICGKQVVPRLEEYNPIEWFAPLDAPSLTIIQLPTSNYAALSLVEKTNYLMWDNVNAAYRRDVLLQYPFRPILFGEDRMWINEALNIGLKLAYTGFSVVEHYHHYVGTSALKRFLAEFYIDKKVINLDPTKPKLKLRFLLSWIKALNKIPLTFLNKCKWLHYNYNLFKSKKYAYQIWTTFNGIEDAEAYLTQNIPQSSSND